MSTPVPGISARISFAACNPSSVCVGGIRTSTIATSGLWARTFRRRSSLSPAWPTTSKPASPSRRTTPSRSSTESSAITTLISRPSLFDQGSYEFARQLAFRHEPAGPAAADKGTEVRAVAARCEHDLRVGLHAGEARRHVESVDVRQVHVEEHELGLELGGGLQAGRAALGLPDHLEALGLEQQARARTEGGVVVHDQDGVGHNTDSARNRLIRPYGYPYLGPPIAPRIRLPACCGGA